jgi:hypothetical protein
VITLRYTELSGNPAHFVDLEVDGRIILKFITEKLVGKLIDF